MYASAQLTLNRSLWVILQNLLELRVGPFFKLGLLKIFLNVDHFDFHTVPGS